MTKEDEEGFVRCPDIILSGFLNGLIYDKRGKDPAAPELALERRVNNNTVLKKLRIAFSLKTDDIVAIMTEQKYRVSVPEVTAMMRAPDHKNYRECGDQFLRNFLRGLTHRVHHAKTQKKAGDNLRLFCYFTCWPGFAPSSGLNRKISFPPGPAAITIPSEMPKRILRGARFATITV
jgi:uncharacterized protein YehS (DUF1456 family)